MQHDWGHVRSGDGRAPLPRLQKPLVPVPRCIHAVERRWDWLRPLSLARQKDGVRQGLAAAVGGAERGPRLLRVTRTRRPAPRFSCSGSVGSWLCLLVVGTALPSRFASRIRGCGGRLWIWPTATIDASSCSPTAACWSAIHSQASSSTSGAGAATEGRRASPGGQDLMCSGARYTRRGGAARHRRASTLGRPGEPAEDLLAGERRGAQR